MNNFNLNYEPSKKNIIKTLIGLLILHYFIFFQSTEHFFSFNVYNYNNDYSRFGRFVHNLLYIKSDTFIHLHFMISCSLLFSYWHFRKKLTCFFEELIKKFIQKV